MSAACLATHTGSGHALAAHTGTGDDLLGTCWLWMRCLVVLRRVDLASRAARPGRVGPAACHAICASDGHAEEAHGGDDRVWDWTCRIGYSAGYEIPQCLRGAS